MKRRFQEGGLAAANQGVDPTSAWFQMMGQFNTTTPEAQRYARGILDEYQEYDFSTEEQLLDQFRETAEQSRAALRQARESVLADQYDPRQKWLAAAQGFGAPTQTGQFGETLGTVAGALRQPMAAEQEFDRQKREELLGLEQSLAGVDEGLLMNEFKLQDLRRRQSSDLAKTALTTLGRQTPQRGKPSDLPPSIKSLDQKMATEYGLV
jgi:hypothetical protein